jgi:alkylation response protein AidB-like acyl-CoA dehydrogenase
MDLNYSQEETAFRDEVRAFCEAELPEYLRRKMMQGQRITRDDYTTWQRILNKRGWAAPLWPKEYGGAGWDATRYYIFKEENFRAWTPEVHNQNISNVGPVIVAYGTPEQKQYFLPKLLNLDIWFCQGFSEPGSGSDLASLKTRAERQGDHYIVNGQKLWTSGAHNADWIYCLVRTDPGVKKQAGISYLLIDMKSPGIEVRPVITLDGNRHVNEVFFNDVKVPVENLIGQENRGWGYAKYLLGNERVSIARTGLSKARAAMAKRLAQDVLIDGRPLSEDVRFREKMALIEVELKALEITNMMVVAGMGKSGSNAQDPRSSVLKLKGSELQQSTTEMLLEVAGPQAMARQVDFLEGRTDVSLDEPWQATAALNYFIARAATIYGGTSEVQHNVAAKGILGL